MNCVILFIIASRNNGVSAVYPLFINYLHMQSNTLIFLDNQHLSLMERQCILTHYDLQTGSQNLFFIDASETLNVLGITEHLSLPVDAVCQYSISSETLACFLRKITALQKSGD